MDEGREMIRRSFQDGSALKKFHGMIVAQGVSKSIADQLVSSDETQVNAILKLSDTQHRAVSSHAGFVQAIDSYKLGTIVQRLGKVTIIETFASISSVSGGGRLKSTDKIDFTVGIRLLRHVGDAVRENEPWAILYAPQDAAKRYPKFFEDFNTALQISVTPVAPLQRIYKVLA